MLFLLFYIFSFSCGQAQELRYIIARTIQGKARQMTKAQILKRREAKRKDLLEKLEEVRDQMEHVTPIEVSMKIIAETLIFILEGLCKKKH